MRAMKGAARTQSKKRLFKRAKGYVGGRRKLWIIRLSAACRERGLRYSQFIAGLEKTGIILDRKSLSEIAITDPAAFDAVMNEVKAAIAA